jgi:hypothetical protein
MASTYTSSVCGGNISAGGIATDVLSGSVTLNKEDIEVLVQTGETVAWPIQVPGGKCWAEYEITFAVTGPVPFTPDALTSFNFVLGTGRSISGEGSVSKVTMNRSESGPLTGTLSGKSSGKVTWS